MRLTGEERCRAEKISLINEIENFLSLQVCHPGDFDAALGDEVKGIADLTFAEDYFARFFLQDPDLWSDPFDDIDFDAVEQSIIAELLDSSRPLSRPHSSF